MDRETPQNKTHNWYQAHNRLLQEPYKGLKDKLLSPNADTQLKLKSWSLKALIF